MKTMNFWNKKTVLKARRHRTWKQQTGIALVAVLLLVVSGTAMAAMVMSISKSTAFTVSPFVQLQRSFYINEGVAARVQYLISADRSLYGSPTDIRLDNYSEYDYDRYLPDAVPHTFDYYGTLMTFVLKDACSAVDLRGNAYQQAFRQFVNFQEEDTDMSDLVEDVTNRVTDYIDGDDVTVDDNSYEEDEYLEEMMHPLPRNGAITIREEYGFIPELKKLYPMDSDGRMSYIRLIPPEISGVTFEGNPDIFGVTDDWLYYAVGLEEDEIEDLHVAVEEFHSVDRTPLSENLDEDILDKLTTYVRWNSTGAYTVVIRPATQDAEGNDLEVKVPGKRLVFTYTAQPVSGPANGIVPFYEWMWF